MLGRLVKRIMHSVLGRKHSRYSSSARYRNAPRHVNRYSSSEGGRGRYGGHSSYGHSQYKRRGSSS
ncbi:hypothetical protein [Paenibacillus sp. MBLB4367]|uniref:hypothetical protein n=1 Tax=Paenibacillus sp. MBLB4367 TaxID=3384767 RepID=UPI003907F522